MLFRFKKLGKLIFTHSARLKGFGYRSTDGAQRRRGGGKLQLALGESLDINACSGCPRSQAGFDLRGDGKIQDHGDILTN